MRSKSSLLFSSLIVTLTLIISLASPTSVHAASITVTPTSGTAGTSVQISGTGFAGRLATIYWDDQMILSKIPISETGELMCDLIVPPACRGNHTIKITDDSNWTSSTASATVTVFPGITIFPRVGRTYIPITVTGNGFTPFEKDIQVTWDDTALPTSTTANHLGLWSINFDVPETTKGYHSISAFSSLTDKSEIGEHIFIVAPFAKVEPTSGSAGTEIKIDGFGFRTGEDGVTITWDNEIILCNIVAGADGSWSNTLNIPPSTQGHHTIGVFGSSFTPKGIVPDTDFEVVPHIELQPTSGNKGTQVTVNGSGFTKDEAITLSFEEITLDAKASADNTGSFSTTFEAPQSRDKDNKVKATGNAGNSAEAIFTTEKIAPLAPILSSPEEGAKLEIYGSVGEVFAGTAKRLIGIIAFRDSTQQGVGLTKSTFDWSDVNTEDRVSYTLQIAHDNDFSSQVLLKEGLVKSEYTLPKEDALAKGSYRWRVKAVDDIGNESPWSEAREFEMIPMPNHVLIMSLVIPVSFIGAIVAAGILIWRRQRIPK